MATPERNAYLIEDSEGNPSYFTEDQELARKFFVEFGLMFFPITELTKEDLDKWTKESK